VKIKLFNASDFMTEKHSSQKKSNLFRMPRVHKRKYEKIDNAEIDLVVQCQDSHEFYKRYRELFPDKKKGIGNKKNGNKMTLTYLLASPSPKKTVAKIANFFPPCCKKA